MIFYATIGSEVVGTARVNIGQLADFPSEIVKTYYMERFQNFYNDNDTYNFRLTSKGMVSALYRNSPVLNALMFKIFELYCTHQVHFGFGNCNFHLLPLHEYYGHRRIGKNIVDPNFGLQASFVMLLDDIQHLEKAQSPLLEVACKTRKLNSRVVDWSNSEFPETASIVNSRLTSKENLRTILCVRLENSPYEVMPILQGLSETEAKNFLHNCGVIVKCPKGDYLVTREAACQELMVLLSGALCSPDDTDINKIVLGQHFGEIGLVNRTKHTLNVMAATDTEILVLSYHYFQKFCRSYPDVATKILHNLT